MSEWAGGPGALELTYDLKASTNLKEVVAQITSSVPSSAPLPPQAKLCSANLPSRGIIRVPDVSSDV